MIHILTPPAYLGSEVFTTLPGLLFEMVILLFCVTWPQITIQLRSWSYKRAPQQPDQKKQT
jgi:hypothetical protein